MPTAVVLLHLLVVGLLPLHDAAAEGRAFGGVEHVSAPGDPDCGTPHHDASCQILNAPREHAVPLPGGARVAADAPELRLDAPTAGLPLVGRTPPARTAARAPPLS